MTPEQRTEIERLAAIVSRRRGEFEAMVMLNVWGKSAEERAEIDGAYEVARTEYMEAQATLDRFQHLVADGVPT